MKYSSYSVLFPFHCVRFFAGRNGLFPKPGIYEKWTQESKAAAPPLPVEKLTQVYICSDF